MATFRHGGKKGTHLDADSTTMAIMLVVAVIGVGVFLYLDPDFFNKTKKDKTLPQTEEKCKAKNGTWENGKCTFRE